METANTIITQKLVFSNANIYLLIIRRQYIITNYLFENIYRRAFMISNRQRIPQ